MFTQAKRSFFFYELHLFNLPLALFLKVLGNVYIFKYRGYCQRFLNNDFLTTIGDFADVDQWVKQKEKASDLLKKNYPLIKEKAPNLTVSGLHLNLSNAFTQNFCIEFEQYLLFLCLVKNYSGKKYISNFLFRSFLKKNFADLVAEGQIKVLPTLAAEYLYAVSTSLRENLKLIIRLFRGSPSSLTKKNFNYICSGVSPSEYPENDDELNFSWLVSNNILKGEDVLYVLQSLPNEKSAQFLKKKNVHYTTKANLIAALTFPSKLSLLADVLKTTLIDSVKYNFKNKIHLHSFIESRIWFEIFKMVQPKYYINSFSAGWPESFETLICKPMNIKSILWFYSAGEFLYTKNDASFQDMGTRFCINESSEIWVWNNLVKKLFQERWLDPESKTDIQVMGSILNGDWKVIEERKPNENLTISVFDLTPMKVRRRLSYGEGPYCNVEQQEKFYQSIVKIHQEFPDANIIIKTKRALDPQVYEIIPTLKYLLEAKLPRITFVSANQNPYIAMAKSDLVISVPYTSPGIMALSFGIPGIYYDPIKLCNRTFQNAFKHITIQDEIELIHFIKNLRPTAHDEIFPVISTSEMSRQLKVRLNQHSR